MRELYILKGLPGCGKSTWIKENKLENYTISSDNLRLLYQAPQLQVDGSYTISQKHDKKVWDLLYSILEDKMDRAETVFIDATHYQNKSISNYIKLIEKYSYRLSIIDFSDISLEECIERDYFRTPKYKRVGEKIITNMYNKMINEKPFKKYDYIKPNDFDLSIYKPQSFDNYNDVVVFGDIHGCYEPLKEYFDKNTFDKNTAYIFTGDYIDRGVQNKETIEFLIDLSENSNVYLLEGNHEKWLRYFAYEDYDKIHSKEFINHTAKQLRSIDKKLLRKFVSRLKLYMNIYFRECEYFINHSGYIYLPDVLTNGRDLTDGIGKYEDICYINDKFYKITKPNDIDYSNDIFSQYKIKQIHAHRNYQEEIERMTSNIDKLVLCDMSCFTGVASIFTKNNINLCDRIEFGGKLRVFSLNEKTMYFYKNNTFNQNYNKQFESVNRLSEIDNPNNDEHIKLLNRMNQSTNIRKKILDDNIISYSFDRNVFEKGNWNDITVKARGLFINSKTNEVVARSYNKFFNYLERRETEKRTLLKNIKYPLEVFVKENGFLGLLSYDKANDKLFISSKSVNEGEFKNYFESFVQNLQKLDEITKFLKNNNKTMIFEVIDIKNDPHIIKYDKSKIVLLDIVENTLINPTYMKYDELVEFANQYQLDVKYKLEKELKNESEFNSFLEKYGDVTYKDCGNIKKYHAIEGFVVKDNNGFMFKVKLPYYTFWKKMRALKDKIVSQREVDESRLDKESKKVFTFMKQFNIIDLAEKSIIDIADEYYKQ